MKAVILAGGTGSRLYPLTKLMNKHLLPVGKSPMICHGIAKLREAGIKDILLIIAKQSAGLYIDYLGNGSQYGVRLTYKVQEEAGGIAQALSLAKDFIHKTEKFILLLGDNLFEDNIFDHVQDYMKQDGGARVFLKQVSDLKRYGVPIIKGNKIVKIEEKPDKPKSPYCVIGIYMYDSAVFEMIESIEPSERGELEITDVNNIYATKGRLMYSIMSGWWTDAGTFESLYEASNYLIGGE